MSNSKKGFNPKPVSFQGEANTGNLPGFNRIVRCNRHNKMCTMMCMAPECQQRSLCQQCILDHTHSHLSRLVPMRDYNEKTDLIPSLVSRELINLRSRIFTLQNQIIVNREARQSELKSLFKTLKELLNRELDDFLQDSHAKIEQYFSSLAQDISQPVYSIQEHLNTLTPYVANQGMEVKSDQVDFIINYQDQLVKEILPRLEARVSQFANRAAHGDVFIQNDNIQMRILQSVRDHLQIKNILSFQEPQKFLKKSDSEAIVNLHYRPDQYENFEKKKFKKFQSAQNIINKLNSQSLTTSLPPQFFQVKENVIPYDKHHFAPPFQRIFTGHTDIVTSLAIIDDQRFISCSGDNTIKLWDTDNAVCAGTFKGHVQDVWDVCGINSMSFASCSGDNLIKIWNIDTISCTKTLIGHTDVVQCLDYSAVKGMIASGGADGTVRLWDLASERNNKILGHHNSLVRCLKFIDEKGYLMSGGADKIIKVWNLNNYEIIMQLKGHESEINSLEYLFVQDGSTYVVSGGADSNLMFWQVQSGSMSKKIKAHNDGVTSIVYVKDQDILLSAGADQMVQFWRIQQNFDNFQTIQIHSDFISQIVYDHQRDVMITSSWDRNIRAQSLAINKE